MTVTEKEMSRRPLKSRDTGWAKAFAAALARWRITPNSISVASVFFSAGSAAALFLSSRDLALPRWLWLLAAAALIQLRLICNLLDGMVAVEGGMKTKSGEVFNDLPDRIADSLIFIATGYAAAGIPYGVVLGWSAGLLAVFTAYVRMLGGAAGLPQSFIGPMAKQQRMAVMTIACILSTLETARLQLGMVLWPGTILWIALIVINAGCVITIIRRTWRIVQELESR